MYSRRLRIAAATGRKNTTFKIAKKIAKLISWMTSVPSGYRNTAYFKWLMRLGTFATTKKM